MYIFITIVFIAEVLIASNLICLINKLDKKVVMLNLQVEKCVPMINDGLKNFTIYVNKFKCIVGEFCYRCELQREQYVRSLIESIITIALLFVLKGNHKKYVSTLKLLLAIGECWKCT